MNIQEMCRKIKTQVKLGNAVLNKYKSVVCSLSHSALISLTSFEMNESLSSLEKLAL